MAMTGDVALNPLEITHAFDSLVSGIGTDERQELLQKLRRYGNNLPQPMTLAREEVRDTDPIRKRLRNESILYRILLWIRAAFTQQRSEELYNYDLLRRLSRAISLQHPGVIDYQRRLLLTTFKERLEALKDCAEFFKPYVDKTADRKGEFYVFLSTLVAPEIADAIDEDADPYSLPLEQTVAHDTKSELVRNLNDTLMHISDTAKQNMRASVKCFEWLRRLTQLRFAHFISQFTQAGNSASCMFTSAKSDYAETAKVLFEATTVSDKVLDALFLFAQDKDKGGSEGSGTEKELQAFTFKAAAKLSMAQAFVSNIPVVSVGKLMWASYDWNPDAFGGWEDWQKLFRTRWREVFDERWNNWMKDRKRKEIENMLEEMFNIPQFPALKNRPWQAMRGIAFRCEMTAGFIVWFCENEYPLFQGALSALMMEGVFIRNDNQTEYSIAANELNEVMRQAGEFSVSIADGGSLSSSLAHLAAERMNTINWQSKITGVMMTAEASIRDISTRFCNQCRTMEKIFHGIFDEDVASGYDGIRNMTAIKGGDNKAFREDLLRARRSLDGARRVLSEVEILDAPDKDKTDDKNA